MFGLDLNRAGRPRKEPSESHLAGCNLFILAPSLRASERLYGLTTRAPVLMAILALGSLGSYQHFRFRPSELACCAAGCLSLAETSSQLLLAGSTRPWPARAWICGFRGRTEWELWKADDVRLYCELSQSAALRLLYNAASTHTA